MKILHISTQYYADGDTSFCGEQGVLCDRDNRTLLPDEQWCPKCLHLRDEANKLGLTKIWDEEFQKRL
jgi:hypothetical protein